MTKLYKSKKLLAWESQNPNPVAKNAAKFNKASIFRDKKNNYSRKVKHKDLVPFNSVLVNTLLKVIKSMLNQSQSQVCSATFC